MPKVLLKHSRELRERGEVSIQDPTKPLKSCSCESDMHILHQTASDPRNVHLSPECLQMILRVLYTREESDLGCDIMGWHMLFHDLLREQLWIVS